MTTEHKKLLYEFAPTGGGTETGFNDSVTNRFDGNVAYYLARESIQNIIDATIQKPAKAVFEMKTLKISDLPDPKGLKEVFGACKEYKSHDKDSVKFFDYALSLFESKKEISVFRIGDYNTCGLTGNDEDQKGAYYSLLKSVGSTSKGAGQGGSFGLGKGAYFAASLLRTIFVSSVVENNKVVFQGKLRLVSHKKGDKPMQGDGSFGYAEQKPIRSVEDIPIIFRRKERGTDIFIVGYEDSENWEEHITKSVLNYFWNSILSGLLEVKVGEIIITKKNIEEVMGKYFTDDQPDAKDNPNPLPYYNAYKNGKVYERDFPILGKCSLRILVNEKYKNHICYMRGTGMMIQKKSHPSMKSYAGVFVCNNTNKKGNEILREMENATHDKWSHEFVKDKEDPKSKENAKTAEKELRSFVNDVIQDLVEFRNAESLHIPGLERLIYLPGENETGIPSGGGVLLTGEYSLEETGAETGDDERIISKNPDIVMIQAPVVTNRQDDTFGPGTLSPTNRGGILKVKNKQRKNRSGSGEQRGKIIENISCRTFASKGNNGTEEHIMIIRGGPSNVPCSLMIQAGTDDAYAPVKITKAINENGIDQKVSDGKITGLSFDKDGAIKLRVMFDSLERYALNVTAYQI
jgi:hypothetical protein